MALSEYYPDLKGWVPAPESSVPPVAPPLPNPQTESSPYLRTTLPLPVQYQPDTLKQYNRPTVSSFRIAPLPPSGLPTVNAAVATTATTIIKKTITSTTGETQTSEMNWRGQWSSTAGYVVDDVVQFNISTYLALKSNSNVKPDSSTTTWALVSKNLNFRGQFGTGGPAYPTLQYWAGNTSFSASSSFVYSVAPTLATWQTVHVYTLGTKIIDSNGNQQTVTTPGTSQPVGHPTWATLSGATTNDGTVVWTCGGIANAIVVGDVLFLATRIDPASGSATTSSVTDTSTNIWTQIGPTEQYVSGLNGKTYTLQVWTTVATKNVPNGGTYNVTVNNTQASDGKLTIVGFSSSVGILSQSSGATSGGSGPLTPGPLSLDQASFLIYASSTDHTSGFTGGTPPWNFVSSGTGSFELDMAWAVIGPGVSNPATNSSGGGGLCAIQSSYISNNLYVPFDTVIFRGSTYVCVSETINSPAVAPSSWVLLSQGTGTVNSLTGNYTAVALDDGRLISNATASSFTLTLPATPPTPWWWISVENSGTGTIVISPNGLNLDGSSSSLTLAQNQGVLIFTDGSNYFTERGFGTVSSVGLSLPGIFIVSGSPVTGSGTLTAVFANEPANTVLAGPSSGAAATPTFRTLGPADLAGGTTNQSLSVNGVIYSDDYEVDVNGQPEITVNGAATGAEMPSQGTGFGNGAAGTAVTTTLKGTGTGPTTPQTIVKYVKITLDGATYWAALMQ